VFFRSAEVFVDRYQGANDRVHMGLAIETGSGWMLASTTSDEIILATEDLAQRKNLRITDHLTGGSPQFIALTGGTEIEYLDRLGALSDRYVFIHGSGLLDPDIARLAEVGASLITNPFGNAYLGGVVAPVRSLVRAGVNVGLGSDGAYVNCSVDMVEQMKGLAMIQNAHNIDATFITAERAIEMATRNNAFAMGLEHEIGTLEVGKQADIAIFDLSKPRIGIPNRPIGALVFSTHGSDVHTVLVGGDILVSEGRLVFDGVEEILAEGRERATAMTQAVGLANTGPDWHR
jgi:5-methylthioadenosine/S-adenosylhomocysteine deaminase